MQQFYQFGDSNLLDLQNTINLRHVGKDCSSSFFKIHLYLLASKFLKRFMINNMYSMYIRNAEYNADFDFNHNMIEKFIRKTLNYSFGIELCYDNFLQLF
jgi:hypothetical protein